LRVEGLDQRSGDHGAVGRDGGECDGGLVQPHACVRVEG